MIAWMLEESVRVTVAFLFGFFLKRWEGDVMEGKKCMIEKCIRPAAAEMRGLCMICYSTAKAKVRASVTTWEKLAGLGLCEYDSDPFNDAYRRAMENQ